MLLRSRVAAVVLGATFVSMAVAQDDHAAKVKASAAKWATAAAECKGNYSYQSTHSSFTGRQTTTTIVVRDGRVVERRLESFDIPKAPPKPGEAPPAPKVEWVETGDMIGKRAGGVPARTLDEWYEVALKLTATPLGPTHRRYSAFDARGLLGHCFDVDTRIADDAPRVGVPPLRIRLGAK